VFFLLISSWSRGVSTPCQGLVLEPTQMKRGQFWRLGMLSCVVEDTESFLDKATGASSLSRELYEDLDVDSGMGYTIEIV